MIRKRNCGKLLAYVISSCLLMGTLSGCGQKETGSDVESAVQESQSVEKESFVSIEGNTGDTFLSERAPEDTVDITVQEQEPEEEDQSEEEPVAVFDDTRILPEKSRVCSSKTDEQFNRFIEMIKHLTSLCRFWMHFKFLLMLSTLRIC